MAVDYQDSDYIFDTHWLSMKRAIGGLGIVSGLEVTAGPGAMQVQAAIGAYYATPTKVTVSSPVTITIGTADPTNPRWDLIFGSSTAVQKRAGTPEAIPKPPNLNTNEIMIALVYVGPGVTTINDADIHSFGFNNDYLEFKQEHNHDGSNSLKVTHANLLSIGANDHHAQLHASAHVVGGADALSVGTPVSTGATNSAGTSTNFCRRDHQHQLHEHDHTFHTNRTRTIYLGPGEHYDNGNAYYTPFFNNNNKDSVAMTTSSRISPGAASFHIPLDYVSGLKVYALFYNTAGVANGNLHMPFSYHLKRPAGQTSSNGSVNLDENMLYNAQQVLTKFDITPTWVLTPAADWIIDLYIHRQPDSPLDTYAGTVYFIGYLIEYTADM